MDFTPEQLTAIRARGGALLVSAGAGSGKTRVLVERLVSYVTDPADPVDVDRFLVITYTRSAAAELRERIGARLEALSAALPRDRRLRRQTALLARAKIGTIHSFCAALLRERAHLLALPQDFRVADETRCVPLRQSVLDRVLEAAYTRIDTDADLRALADTVGAGRDDKRLETVILSLYDRMRSHPDPEKWAAKCVSDAECAGASDAGDTVWGAWLLADARESAAAWRARLLSARADLAKDPALERAYGESFSGADEGLLAFLAAAEKGWDAARDALPVPFPRLRPPRKPYDADAAETAKAHWNACKEAMKKLEKRLNVPSAQALADLRAAAPAARALLRLTLDFDAAYTREKRRQSLLDYGDLEHLTLGLLLDENGAPTDTAREVSRRFTEVMVDEYQDVNAVQDAIFSAVSRDGENLFLVGDVKQSIYRFRLADPTLFLRRYDAFGTGEGGRRLLLRRNFRSRPEILNAVNHVFSNILSRQLGELDYDENAALLPGAEYPPAGGPLVRLTAVDSRAEDEEDERTAAQAEAAAVARQLRALFDAGTTVFEDGRARPLRWGDVCVLLRAPGSLAADFRAALENARIPVQAEQGADFFECDEVTVTLHLLALADNPRQDLPLVSVLRSALFGFDADALSAIRAADRRASFYDALCLRAETDENCRAFLDLLSGLREDARDRSVHAFLWRVYARTGALAVAAALPGGAARRENLLRLAALARRFEENGSRGLGRFLRWIEALRENNAAPALVSAGGDAVRVMSIHRSKGLEFPVVFLAGLGHRFNRSDASETLPVDASLGLGLRRTDLELGVEYPTIARAAVSRSLTRQLLSEEMRVLYVAMTRAKERLYMSCALKDPEKKLASLALGVSSPIDPCLLEDAASMADWLLRAALLPDCPFPLEVEKPEAAQEENGFSRPLRGLRMTDEAEVLSFRGGGPAADVGEGIRNTPIPDLAPLLSYRYPFAAAERVPAKLTATELKSRVPSLAEDGEAASLLPKEPETFRMPDFGGAKGPLTGAQKGTATHRFLQYADLAAAAKPGGVEKEKARLLSAGALSPEEAAAVDTTAIEGFLATEPGRLVARAAAETAMSLPQGAADPFAHVGLRPPRNDKDALQPVILRPQSGRENPSPASPALSLRRELRFSLLEKATDYFPEAPEGDALLLQGIVDCCVFEPDGITVLDYKTDRVRGEALEARSRRYAPQLRAYARALARMTGRPVKRCLLVFLFSGELRAVDF